MVASVGAIVGLTQAHLAEIYKDSDNLNKAMSDLGGEMMNIESTFQTDMTNIETTSQLASDYITQLERLETTGVKTREEQQKYVAIIQKLKALIPGLNIEIDKQTGLIVGGANAIKSQTQAWKEQAVQQAMLTKQTQQVDALAKAIQAVSDAEIASANNAAELQSKRAKLADIERQIADATGRTLDEINALSLQDRSGFWQQQTTEANQLKASWNAVNQEVTSLVSGQSALDTAMQNANASVAAATAEVDKTTAAYEAAYGVMANTEAATAGADTVEDSLEDVGTAADNAAKDVRDFSSDVTDMAKNLKDEADITLKEATKNLQENTKLYNNLWTNIGSLMKRGVSKEFLFHLQQMGPSGWA